MRQRRHDLALDRNAMLVDFTEKCLAEQDLILECSLRWWMVFLPGVEPKLHAVEEVKTGQVDDGGSVGSLFGAEEDGGGEHTLESADHAAIMRTVLGQAKKLPGSGPRSQSESCVSSVKLQGWRPYQVQDKTSGDATSVASHWSSHHLRHRAGDVMRDQLLAHNSDSWPICTPSPGTTISWEACGPLWPPCLSIGTATAERPCRLVAHVGNIREFFLCLVYLLIFPFHPAGMAILIGIGAVAVTLIGRPDDTVTTGITIAVVMVVAALSPHNAWQHPILRKVDTAAGGAVGVAAAWIGPSAPATSIGRSRNRPTLDKGVERSSRGPAQRK